MNGLPGKGSSSQPGRIYGIAIDQEALAYTQISTIYFLVQIISSIYSFQQYFYSNLRNLLILSAETDIVQG